MLQHSAQSPAHARTVAEHPWAVLDCARRFVGEWYHPHEGQGSPTEEQTEAASKNCFAVGGIYLGFTVLAIVLTCYFDRKAKRSV